jgi:hypothetical protein
MHGSAGSALRRTDNICEITEQIFCVFGTMQKKRRRTGGAVLSSLCERREPRGQKIAENAQ